MKTTGRKTDTDLPFVPWRRDTVRLAGVRVPRIQAGSSDPSAPVVLLLHGLGHWGEIAWTRLVARLDPARRYVAIDLPGLGNSDKPPIEYDGALYRRAIDDAAASLGVARYVVAGHSLGGFLAADHAAAHPDRVAALGLIAPAGFMRAARVLMYGAISRYVERLMLLEPPTAIVRLMHRQSVVDDAVLTLAEREATLRQARDPALRRTFAHTYRYGIPIMLRHREVLARFGGYAGPVFCAWGAKDRFIPARTMRTVQRVYPHVRTIVLPRSAHLPMIEEAAPLAAAFETFFATSLPS